MSIRSASALAAGLVLIWVVGGAAGSIEEATYSALFDRAAGLVPGRTTLEPDLSETGEWAFEGGEPAQADEGIKVDARAERVEVVWKGGFPRELPRLMLTCKVQAPCAVRVLPHVFTGDRFNRVGSWISVEPDRETAVKVNLRGAGFGGFKLLIEGKDLENKSVVIQKPTLSGSFCEGYFRKVVDIPRGEIWEAVAEVGDCGALYVNGRKVEDETIITPRPATPRGADMYLSRRVSLKAYVKPGRNVLGLFRPQSRGAAPAMYLRGAVVMASGERIELDTGTDWVWSREAPEGWLEPGYDASGWDAVVDHADMPREAGLGSYYKGEKAVATTISRFGLSYRPRGSMPCYDGLVKLRNPEDRKLFFREGHPFRLQAMIPPGFADRQPVWAWEVSRYADEGSFSAVADGQAAEFEASEGSLVTTIHAESLERGVYVLTSRLQVEGRTLEERDPEVLVVTGKQDMPKSAGDTLEQGLDLKLETVVDFTDPVDPHPWFETDHKGPLPGGNTLYWGPEFYHTMDQPLIVEKNGLKYRTTRPVNRAQFSYKVDFEHPGDWYVLVLEYPDDAERWIGVSCNASSRMYPVGRRRVGKRADASSKCGPAIWTGGKYPNTGKMLEMKWIYRPDPGPHAFNVMSLMKDTEAAAARLRIYHVEGALSELDSGELPLDAQRRFGMVTERTYPWANGIYNAFSSFAADEVPNMRGSNGAGSITNNAVVDGCMHLSLMQDAAAHYAEYMRFAGQNLHAMGCFQYSDDNTASQYITGSPRLHDSSENMLARVLQANDLYFYASVEFVSTQRLGEDPQPEWFFADRYGERPMSQWAGKALNLNFLHPKVEGAMLELARQLAECFKHQSNFLGINWTAYFHGFFIPSYRTYSYPLRTSDPLANGYDNLTVGMFEADTGIDVPVDADDPQRHQKRYQFLTSDTMKPRWTAWRSRKMAEFFTKVTGVIQAVRPDLETVAGCYFADFHIAEWKEQGTPFETYLNEWGWAPEAFSGRQDVWLMPWIFAAARHKPAGKPEGYAMAWQANHDPGFYGAYQGLDKRAIMLLAGWIEVERAAANYPYRVEWPRPYQQTMMGQQREEMAMEPYTHALIGFDPQMIMMGFTDVSPYVGVEEMQRKFTRVLRRLPMGRFERILDTGFGTDLAIRGMRQGDTYHFYVVNPGYWPVKGSVTLEGATGVSDMVSGKPVSLKGSTLSVSLEPFGVAAFTAQGAGAGITAWAAEPPEARELSHLRKLLERARTAVDNPDMAAFLGEEDYAVLSDTVSEAAQALTAKRHAAAWHALTDADFWTVLFQKAPEIEFAEFTAIRGMTAPLVESDMAPTLDGVLDDKLWQGPATKAEGPFVTVNKAYAEVPTFVRMAASGRRLFIAIECRDPDPEKIRGTTDKDDVNKAIWGSKDDLVDFFIMPDDHTYYQFAVTANGAQFDQQNRLRHGVRTVDYEYAPQWKAAVARDAAGWSVEVEMDVEDAFGHTIEPGTEWKLNVYRQYGMNRHPMSSWSYNPGQWHSLEHLGSVRFVKPGDAKD